MIVWRLLTTIKDRILLITAIAFFLLGISLPMFSLEKFFIFKDAFSLLGGIFHLTKAGEWLLALVIFTFSILTPLYKFFICWKLNSLSATYEKKRVTLANRLLLIGKWSMADVFIIAVMAATVKFGGLATVNVHIGLFFFTASVLLSLLVSHQLLSDYELQPKAL